MDRLLHKILIDAIILFDKKANELINLLADRHDLDLNDENPFGKLLRRDNNLWRGEIAEGWSYRFHGGSCEFLNTITGQFLDVHINKRGQFGSIDYFFLYKFITTTKELEDVKSGIHSMDVFSKIIKELEEVNVIIDIGDEYFPIRVLNYSLIDQGNIKNAHNTDRMKPAGHSNMQKQI